MRTWGLWRSLRLTCRSLARQPLFALMVVVILAIGIAGMTTVFSLFNGLFLRPFPVANQDRIVDLQETDLKTGMEFSGVAYSRFHVWHENNRTFECMGFCSFWGANLAMGDRAERVSVRLASHDFLNVLGIRPVLGRNFTVEEDRPGGTNVILLSHSLWTRMFAKDPAVLGTALRLDNDLFTVVGILPAAADFPEPKDIWQPLRAGPQQGHGGVGSMAMGLLKPGVTAQQAREDLTGIHQGWLQQHPEKDIMTLPTVTPMRELYRTQLRSYRLGTSILLSMASFVLLIACCNVMSIMLARGAYQCKEFAVHAALGASRRHIVQQILTECLVLSVVGGALGIALGNYALHVLLSWLADEIPRWMRFTADLRCALFCIGVVCAVTLLSGFVPALHAVSSRHLHAVLQSAGTRTTISRSRRWTLNAIVSVEVALALTLLIGAGLLLRVFRQIQSTDTGFHKAGVLTYNIALPIGPYYDETKRRGFWEQHLEKVRAVPGVTSAALSNYLPMKWADFGRFEIEGATQLDASQLPPPVLTQRITPGYFDSLGITLRAGRFFLDPDNQKNSESVAVVNEAFVRHFSAEENPIDKRVRPQNSRNWIRIVGVAADVINVGPDVPAWPCIYLPTNSDVPFYMFGIVHTSGDPLSLVGPVRAVIRSVDPGLPMDNIRTMSQRFDESMWLRRLIAWLFGAPAAAAAVMASAGVYGVISYSVSRRTQEIGIRMALGATVFDVMRMIIVQGLWLILPSIGFGIVGGFVLSHALASLPGMLYTISPTDPLTFIGSALLLVSVVLLACCVPARRVATINPMEAFRCE